MPGLLFVIALAPALNFALPVQEQVQEQTAEPAAVQQPGESTPPVVRDVSAEHVGEIETFFAKLGEALRSGDEGTLATCFSGEKMAQSCDDRGLLKIGDDKLRAALIEAIDENLDESFPLWCETMAWDRIEFRSFTAGEKQTVVVVTRGWNGIQQVWTLIRWWLARNEDGSWVVFDFEDLDTGLRTSTMLGIGVEATRSGAAWLPKLTALITYSTRGEPTAGVLETMDDLERLIDEVLEDQVPADIEAFVLILKINNLLGQEEGPREALLLTGRLQKLMPDSPIVWYLRGIANFTLEQYSESVAACEKYAELTGWDSDICEKISDSWFQLDEREKARKFAEQGLQDNPQAWGCLASLAVSLPDDRKAELEPWLARCEYDIAVIEMVIDWTIEQEEWSAADFLFALLKKHHADSELIPYYETELGR